MKRKTELIRKCSLLPCSKKNAGSEYVIKDTVSALDDLINEYSPAEVLGTLAGLWPYGDAADFFSKADFLPDATGEITTVATSYYRAYNGGVERVNAELISLWISMGYKIVLFTDEPENDNDYPYPQTVRRIVIPSADHIEDRLMALQKYCADEKIDLFINHKWTDQRLLWECLLIRKLGIPYIQYCHSFFPEPFANGKIALYQPQAFRLCSLIIALSETNARFYQMCGCRTFLVQNPVPGELKGMVSLANPDSARILFIGRISEEKNPMDALRVFRMAHDRVKDAVLDVVGSGDEELLAQMKAYVSENELESCVVFHGLKTGEEVRRFYEKAACVIMTSRLEGYPLVVLETKAYGIPMVMYELPYLSLLKDKKGFLSAPAGDRRSLADYLIRLLEDDDYRKKIGAEARESFESFAGYDLKAAWKEIIDFCSDGHAGSDAYYDPEDLADSDNLIIPSLFEKLKAGYDYSFTSSRDYKLGSALLRLPRRVKKILNKR